MSEFPHWKKKKEIAYYPSKEMRGNRKIWKEAGEVEKGSRLGEMIPLHDLSNVSWWNY